MSIILLDGIIGQSSNDELDQVERFGTYIDQPVGVFDVVKTGKRELGLPDDVMLFGQLNADLFRKVREAGYCEVGRSIRESAPANAIVRTDASLLWENKIYEHDDYALIHRNLPVDLIITLVDASGEITSEFSGQRAQNKYSRQFTGQNLSTRDVLQWQTIEMSNSKDWAIQLSKLKGRTIPHYTLAVGEQSIELFKAATIPNIKRIYYTYAMTDASPEDIAFRDAIIDHTAGLQILASDPKTIEVKLSQDDNQVVNAECIVRDLYGYTQEADYLLAIFPRKAASPGHWAEVNYARMLGIPIIRISLRESFSPFELPHGTDYLARSVEELDRVFEGLGIHKVQFDFGKYLAFKDSLEPKAAK